MDRVAEKFKRQEYYHEFQPICDFLGKSRLGYEALFRNAAGIHPEAFFQDAVEKHKLAELDMQSLNYAISAFFQLPANHKNVLLFVNVFPSTIMEASFLPFVEEISAAYLPFLNRTVLEINESIMKSELRYDSVFIQRVSDLRRRGFLIALDDVGDGTDTFRNIHDLAPDYIKVDRYYSKLLSVSKEKQQVVRLFVEFCQNDIQLILEGVENNKGFRLCCTTRGEKRPGLFVWETRKVERDLRIAVMNVEDSEMSDRNVYSRKATLSLKISEFEVPPMQDLLIIGRKAPIGPEAVRRMAEALSPEQFTLLKMDHPKIEAVLLRNALLQMIDEKRLMNIILEEAERMISDSMVLRSELKIAVTVQREVELS